MRPLVIGGAPGTGKTSVAAGIAASLERGVHIETDHFFRFLPARIDPSLAEAKAQNESVVRAYCAAARQYAKEGWSVVLEGVIGPWMFPVMTPVLGAFDYVLLLAPERIALARLRGRSAQPSATASVAERMYPQFAAVSVRYREHVIDTGERSIDEAVRIVLEKRAAGACAIPGESG